MQIVIEILEKAIEHSDFTDAIDEANTIIEADKSEVKMKKNEENYNDDIWCNTCEFKHLESECLGCAEYDEYDNLISLRHYKRESEDKE